MYTLPYSAVSSGDSGSSKRKKYTLMYIEVLVNVHPPVQCWISMWLVVISKKEWFFMLLRFGDYINWHYKQWFITLICWIVLFSHWSRLLDCRLQQCFQSILIMQVLYGYLYLLNISVVWPRKLYHHFSTKKYYLLCTQNIKTINVFMEKVKTFV